MINKSPAFQFYAADFLIGVMGMSDEEIGVYIKMLAVQWEHGSLPNDKKMIKKLINSRKVPSEMVLLKFAISDDGFLRNSRLEKERSKQKTFKENATESGKKGGNPNFKKGESNPYYAKKDNLKDNPQDNPTLILEDNPKISSSSSSSSSVLLHNTTPLPPEGELVGLAKAIWEKVPKLGRERSSKAKLLAALKKIPAKDLPSVATAIEAIRAWEKSATWTKEDGQFVCGCDQWVKNRQWENIPSPAIPPRKKFAGCQEELEIPDLVAVGRQRRLQQQLQQQAQ